jgi:hypothetical protein
MYFYHRYQLEAATKLVGGMFYNYALRGDGQVITRAVPKSEQLKALDAITEAIKPANLVLPQNIIDLIPPRPAGYSFSRELFVRRTGLVIDALTPAESLTDFVFSFLLQTERMNRMVQYKQQHNGLGLDDVLTSLINKTWKAPRETGIKKLIQLQNEQILLTYLLAASIDENAAYTTRALIQAKLNELKSFIDKNKTSVDETYKGHLLLALERMKAPDKAKPTVHKPLPPGAPIGCDMD